MGARARPSRSEGLEGLTAAALRREIDRGAVRAVDVAEACLARIDRLEPGIRAWAHLDAAHVMRQAEALDRLRATGRPTGPLHGVPVGIKDIIDTADFLTENGTVLDAGRRPRRDATAVARLRAAGAVIMGKTVTTELAVFHPGPTCNPHDPTRTPGGSSSGSAAAVAAFMVPLAVGTQTNGSVIRPASFCGVVGFKPTRGLIPRTGMLAQSPAEDTPGVFARTVEDAALIADAVAGHDPEDPATRPAAHPRLLATAQSPPPVTPALAFVRTPVWERAGEDVAQGFAELADALGPVIEEAVLPAPFDKAHGLHGAVVLADLARCYAGYAERGWDRLSARLRGMIEEGRAVRATQYAAGLASIDALDAALQPLLDRYDALVTPAAAGEALFGLESTGDPAFCTIWTHLGVPAVTLPLLVGGAGLPVGVQLVGRRHDDGRLLRTARWLMDRILDPDEGKD